MAGRARDEMLRQLKAYCREQGSISKAAEILKCKKMSPQWVKKFASGEIPSPGTLKLQILEKRLTEVQAQDRAA